MEENLNQTEAQAMAEAATKAAKTAPAKPQRNLSRFPRIWWGLGLGIVAAAIIVVVNLVAATDILYSLIAGAFAYFFVASLVLWDDCVVVSVIGWFFERTIQFPGLIWEFDLDGFLWLIGMKLLFWVIGWLFGLLCGIVGILVGILISPIAYFFGLHEYIEMES